MRPLPIDQCHTQGLMPIVRTVPLPETQLSQVLGETLEAMRTAGVFVMVGTMLGWNVRFRRACC